MTDKYIEPRCIVCMHRDRDTIDIELMKGIRTGRDIAREFDVTEQAISGHRRKHLIANIRDKLKEIVKTSIMDGIKPENTSDLIKLMTFVEQMENDEFNTGKEGWNIKKNEMFDTFKSTVNGFMFRDLSDYDKNVIIRIAEDIFVRESTDKVGDLLRSFLDIPNPNIGV